MCLDKKGSSSIETSYRKIYQNGNKITVNYKQKANNNKEKKIENNKQSFSFDGEN